MLVVMSQRKKSVSGRRMRMRTRKMRERRREREAKMGARRIR